MNIYDRNTRRFQPVELQNLWLLVTRYYSIASKFARVLDKLKA